MKKAYIIYYDESIKEFYYPNSMDFSTLVWGILHTNNIHNYSLNILNVISHIEYIEYYIEKNPTHSKLDYQIIDKYLLNKNKENKK